MTLTAMRPDIGFENGREVSLCGVAQASSLISTFNVVFSDLYGSLAPFVHDERAVENVTNRVRSLVRIPCALGWSCPVFAVAHDHGECHESDGKSAAKNGTKRGTRRH